MKAYLALTSIVLCFIWHVSLFAQNTTVINQFVGDTTGKGVDGFRMVQSSEQKIIINYYEPIEESELDRLEELISASLSFYIDHGIVRDKNRYKLKKPRKQMVRDMNEIVANAIKFYDFKEVRPFNGFSEKIDDQIANIESQDLYKMAWAKSTTDESKLSQLAYLHTQKELRTLKDLAITEVKLFSTENLVAFAETETTFTDSRTSDDILQDWIQYDAETMLPIAGTEKYDSELKLMNIEDRSTLPLVNTSAIGSNTSEVFMQQMLEMMQLSNAEMKAMREEFNDFREEQLAMWRESEEKNNTHLQSQIDDLKGMVVDIVRYSKGDGAVVSSDALIDSPILNNTSGFPNNLPKIVNVFFASGSTQFHAASILALNEIVDILARNPQLNIILTGYSDNQGDEMKNLILSQDRARSVKRFLGQSGLDESRFITRYLGEMDSQSESQSDRRVSMEFV